ncbi:MAG TPA: hypothetical protein VGV89_04605 [Thermoplasmata archaeon]|nr:hypothetical protein [Thermoplasmata archaeon]
MNRTRRTELEQLVQDLDRDHPEWSAREIEGEVLSRSPVAYGEWKEETPAEGSRLRSVQRWRGTQGKELAVRQAQALFPYLWPLGERQRHELEPTYAPSSRISNGSWRVFLYNCGPEVLRELHVLLDAQKIGYSPFLVTGKFAELQWQRVATAKAAAMANDAGIPSHHELEVHFVVAKGTKKAKLGGALVLQPGQGWVEFDAGDGRKKEIE